MNNPSPESKENVKELIIEAEASRYLKMREEVFHPHQSWKFYFREFALILIGISWTAFHLYRIIQGDNSNWAVLFFGIYFICNGAYLWHKKDIDQIHKRMDGILDLYFENKQDRNTK